MVHGYRLSYTYRPEIAEGLLGHEMIPIAGDDLSKIAYSLWGKALPLDCTQMFRRHDDNGRIQTQTFIGTQGGAADVYYDTDTGTLDLRYLILIHPSVTGLEQMAKEYGLPFNAEKIHKHNA